MHRSVVALFCIIFVVDVYGASRKISTSIDKDVIEITRRAEKLWSLKPAIFKRAKPMVYCQIMDQCCDTQDRLQAVSLLLENIFGTDGNRFVNIVETCMNTTTFNKENQLCSATVKSIVSPWMISQNLDAAKYMGIMYKFMNIFKEFNYITFSCNSEEIHALFCLSSTKLVESCAGKMLQKIYDYDQKSYGKTIKRIKQIFINTEQELIKVLIKKKKKKKN